MANLATMLISLERFSSGLRRRAIQVGDHRIVYSEGGKGEPVVLVHGFNASADTWNRFAGRLTKRYHVVAPDLPGWGASTRLEAESYGYPKQVERLRQFLALLGLRRVHMVGHSMGGFIATAYAAQHPEEIITLTLMAPHGVAEPQPSDLARSVAEGDNWLVADSPQAFDRLLNNVFAKRPYVPGFVLQYLAKRTIQSSAKSAKIFAEMQTNDPPLEERLPRIKAPTLIVWGDQDRVLHVSSLDVFRLGIKGSEVLMLRESGHMPMTENTRQCAVAWQALLDKPRQAFETAA
jgi:pimeloyl-ACP methyl ester carboxylesterase